MRQLPWYRLYSEARNDAKLRSLDDAQHRVWFQLLCLAAEQSPRGTIPGMPDHLLALEVAGGDEALLAATVTRLVHLQILSDGGADGLTFVHFAERQADYPSDLPGAVRERVRRHRAAQTGDDIVTSVTTGNDRKRDVTSGHEGVTPGNELSRGRVEERREEESREEEIPESSRRGESLRGGQSDSAAPPQLTAAEAERPGSKTGRATRRKITVRHDSAGDALENKQFATPVTTLTEQQVDRLRTDFAALGSGLDDYLGEALSFYVPRLQEGKHSNLYACVRGSLRRLLDRSQNGQHPRYPGPPKAGGSAPGSIEQFREQARRLQKQQAGLPP